MEIIPQKIPGVLLIRPKIFFDERGFFLESYNERTWGQFDLKDQFIQDNHSFSKLPHTLRGLHYQKPPCAQTKLIRVLGGKILDVIVDMRLGSPTFGEHLLIPLDATSFEQVYIPKGCAHGFCTLTENCHVLYKVDDFYSSSCNAGIQWNDPDLKIPWPTTSPILSDQDLLWPSWKETFKTLK